MEKSTKSLMREVIEEEYQKIINFPDKDQRIEHLFNVLMLKTCLITFDEIDGGELEKLVRAFEKLKGDVSLLRSREAIDDIIVECSGDFGRC